ncbi:hypothetical protein Tpen_0676 [Thermofilum pendens Hrk 5]|uniref:Uncharacterized protein n=1 Tax=Thermofilum pendens (strain DSM 2475 / Hrk 5) TaxID=368408 RepID=A1RXZ8_THEPD|nr:hypothetical protein Tpen_0676 [Thermofilum pendens Hrk 5]
MKRRRAAIGLLAVALLSLAVLQNSRSSSEVRVLYYGENVYMAYLAAAREACASNMSVEELVDGLSDYFGPLRLADTRVARFERSDKLSGVKYCNVTVTTKLGARASFELNYTYTFLGFFAETGTGRIVKVYRINAYQRFKIPEYRYAILLQVDLVPTCESITYNGTLEVRIDTPCVLRDKWGFTLTVP